MFDGLKGQGHRNRTRHITSPLEQLYEDPGRSASRFEVELRCSLIDRGPAVASRDPPRGLSWPPVASRCRRDGRYL